MTVCLDTNDPSNNWAYCPSLGAAILFTILFFVVTFTHIVLAIKYKKRFCWVIITASIWETVGFGLRAASTQNETSSGLYTPMFLLILLAPIWINAFVYMILGRMILFFLPDRKALGVKASRLTLCFVLLDVTAFLVQAAGGSMITSTDPSTIQDGLHVYMAGVGVQEGFVLLFSILAARFHIKVRQIETGRSTHWKGMLYVVYATLTLITIRIIYRLIEYSKGVNSPAPTHEVYFYVFDALPMLTAITILCIWHPGSVLIGTESEFPKKTRAQKKEEKIQRKEEKRQKKIEKANGVSTGGTRLNILGKHRGVFNV